MASKAGFAGFTSLPNFREKIGVKVNKALKLGHDGISHAAIDMVCALMEPMHEDYDLKQEQLNKSSLLSSERFLDGLLDMWTTHVVIIMYNYSICYEHSISIVKEIYRCIFYPTHWFSYKETFLPVHYKM